MVALKWPLHKYIEMFFRLFRMLNRGPNKAHVGGDHCQLAIGTYILYVFPYCYYWEQVEEHVENFGNRLKILRDTMKTPKSKKIKIT